MFASRFKAYLIPHHQLKEEAVRLTPHLQELPQDWALNPARAPELAFRLLTLFLESRAPGRWWRRRQSRLAERPSLMEFWELGPHLFNQDFQIAHLPASLQTFLVQWQREKLPLLWLKQAPQPLDLLIEQTQGRRVLTFCFSRAQSGALVDGRRDSFEFMLHDLIHASLFFGDHHQEQVAFFKAFLAWQQRWFAKSDGDEIFQQELDYVMSDMNSVPQHMLASTQASLISRVKRQYRLSRKDRLLPEQEALWQTPYQDLCRRLNPPTEHPLNLKGGWVENRAGQP